MRKGRGHECKRTNNKCKGRGDKGPEKRDNTDGTWYNRAEIRGNKEGTEDKRGGKEDCHCFVNRNENVARREGAVRLAKNKQYAAKNK